MLLYFYIFIVSPPFKFSITQKSKLNHFIRFNNFILFKKFNIGEQSIWFTSQNENHLMQVQ
jgi:hypothetical protein